MLWAQHQGLKSEVSFVHVAQVVLTQIAFKAKSGNGRTINYDVECRLGNENREKIEKKNKVL